jgi:hypothetical protein
VPSTAASTVYTPPPLSVTKNAFKTPVSQLPRCTLPEGFEGVARATFEVSIWKVTLRARAIAESTRE